MRGKERDALPHVVVYVEYVVYVGHPYVELQLMRFLRGLRLLSRQFYPRFGADRPVRWPVFSGKRRLSYKPVPLIVKPLAPRARLDGVDGRPDRGDAGGDDSAALHHRHPVNRCLYSVHGSIFLSRRMSHLWAWRQALTHGADPVGD